MTTLVNIDKLVLDPPELGYILHLSGLPGSGSKIYDRSPYGNHGSITGATWVRTPGGLWCLSFDGSDDYVSIADARSLDLSTGNSMACWVALPVRAGSSPTLNLICCKTSNYTCGLIRHEPAAGSHMIIYHADNYDAAKYASFVFAGDNNWHFLVGTFSGTRTKVYWDAILQDTATSDDTWTNNTETLKILGGIASRYKDGKIALLKIYNRPLSALEIQNHFNREKHLFGV